MILKEFKWLEEDIQAVLLEVRSAVKKEILKFPGAVAHRLHPSNHDSSLGKKAKRD